MFVTVAILTACNRHLNNSRCPKLSGFWGQLLHIQTYCIWKLLR